MKDDYKRILKQFAKPRTTNEAIDRIFSQDVKKDSDRVLTKGWKYYVHLNKLVAPLEKWGMLERVGEKMGPTNRMEKVWKKTEKDLNDQLKN